jgi:hypothetical protein
MSLVVGVLHNSIAACSTTRYLDVPCLNVRLNTDSLIALTYKKQEFAAPILILAVFIRTCHNNSGIDTTYVNSTSFFCRRAVHTDRNLRPDHKDQMRHRTNAGTVNPGLSLPTVAPRPKILRKRVFFRYFQDLGIFLTSLDKVVLPFVIQEKKFHSQKHSLNKNTKEYTRNLIN